MKELELCAKKLVINKECSDVLEASELATINLQLQQRMDKLEREGEAMSTANAEMQQLLSVIPLVLIGVSRNDRVILWNKLAETTFGIASINAIGRKLHECGIQWEWEKVDKMVLKSQEVDKLSQTDTVRYVVQGGNRGFLDVTVIPSLSETVEMEHVLILGRDVTEWKKIGDQMVQIQKLEAIGQLASGIAHEINSPIQYISDNTRFLKEAFADICKLLKHYSHLLELNKTKSVSAVVIDEIESECRKTDLEYLLEEIPEAIGQSQEGIARVTEIVKAMKSFSHPGSEEVVPVDINEAIRSTITVARNEWKYVADMKTDFDPILPMIPCFPSEFNQVILNMIINATHAIEELQCDGVGGGGKGVISICTHYMGEWAEIRIRDTGIGIPEECRLKLFEPFFTTKEAGKGTGQGLSIAHSVVVGKHKGTIAFDTEPGKGTTFIIRLPILLPGKIKE